jgi:hypothetical protein
MRKTQQKKQEARAEPGPKSGRIPDMSGVSGELVDLPAEDLGFGAGWEGSAFCGRARAHFAERPG